jgi:hypothetical protein
MAKKPVGGKIVQEFYGADTKDPTFGVRYHLKTKQPVYTI